jgi:ABC-type Zn uptake system ZnuABC Zn-binding protein ZnuA
VLVSVFPVYDLTRRIAGPDADVALVVPEAQSAHGFKPSPKETELAAHATLGVMVGAGLDSFMEKLVKEASPKARILKVADRVPVLRPRPGTTASDEDEATDPHVWLNPQHARLIAKAISEELRRVDPPHATAYSDREAEVDRSLASLDKEVETRTKALTHRELVTFHASFQYFAERYGLDVVDVVELRPGVAPADDHLAALRGALEAKHIPVIYKEPQLDAQPAKDLADAMKIPIATLDPLGGGPETDSYERLVRFDVSQLEKYLR